MRALEGIRRGARLKRGVFARMIVEPRSRRDVLDLAAHSRAFLASLDDEPNEDDFCALLPVGWS